MRDNLAQLGNLSNAKVTMLTYKMDENRESTFFPPCDCCKRIPNILPTIFGSLSVVSSASSNTPSRKKKSLGDAGSIKSQFHLHFLMALFPQTFPKNPTVIREHR